MLHNTPHLLTEYWALLQKGGPDSKEAEEFFNKHRDDSEFVRLAELILKVEKAIKEAKEIKLYQ